MAVTVTTVAAATTMMAAVAAVFLAFVLCFYIFLCAKRYRGGEAPAQAPAGGGAGLAARLRFLFGVGGGGGAAGGDGAAAAWCYHGGLDEASMAALPRREVGKGEALDCAVCITELAAGETARVLPRCGHGFHVDCVDMWLRSHSTCPLCRCPAVDPPPAPPPPEADPEFPNFPTNILFFGSQDEVSTGGGAQPRHQSRAGAGAAAAPPPALTPSQAEAARVTGLRRLLGCGGASPPQHQLADTDRDRDIEVGLAGGESSASRPAKPPQPGS